PAIPRRRMPNESGTAPGAAASTRASGLASVSRRPRDPHGFVEERCAPLSHPRDMSRPIDRRIAQDRSGSCARAALLLGALPPSLQSLCSHPKRAAKSASGVVRLRTVVINEHLAIAAVAEQRTAECAHLTRRLDPAGRLRIELAERLQL